MRDGVGQLAWLWKRGAVRLVLLLCFFAMALQTATATSLTVDEGLHIASGYTVWRTGDYRLIEEHPPLVKLWLSLPLLAMPGLDHPASLPAWTESGTPTTDSLPLLHMAQQLLYTDTPFDIWLFPARTMSALLGVVLLAAIARWAKGTAGAPAALFALAMAAFDPNLVAHAAVAGTDLGAATFITLGLWQSARFLRRPRLGRAAASAALLGLALSSKLTSLLLGPPLALSGLLAMRERPAEERWRLFGLGLVVAVLAGITLWASYGFEVGPAPDRAATVPAPSHMTPIRRLLSHSRGGHQAYLLGRNATEGWLLYFPVAFLVKTPLPALAASVAGLAVALSKALDPQARRSVAAAISPAFLFAVTYVAASLLSPLNIGYRHLLPLLPLLYLSVGGMAGGATHHRRARKRTLRVALAALVVGQAAATLRQMPHLIPYFNAAVGGPRNGWRYLADSNTDWGQAYRDLAAYQQEQGTGPLKLSAFVFYDPADYGVDYTPLTPLGGDTPAILPSRFAPEAGNYAVSATPLDGIPLADPEMYDWFRWRAPDAQVGNAIFVYTIRAAETETNWLAQCSAPVVPLSAGAVAGGFGALPARQFAFDCTRTWVYPDEAAGPGAYVLHGALVRDTLKARLHFRGPPATKPFIDARLAAARIAYRQRAYRSEPAFALFRQMPFPDSEGAATLPTTEVPAPIDLEGPLTFLGTEQRSDGAILEIETWWRVTSAPDAQLFSIVGHAVSEDGEVLAVDDGLGVAPSDLREGDTLVRTHRFGGEVPQSVRFFRTGAYWSENVELWRQRTDPQSTTILVDLDPAD